MSYYREYKSEPGSREHLDEIIKSQFHPEPRSLFIDMIPGIMGIVGILGMGAWVIAYGIAFGVF